MKYKEPRPFEKPEDAAKELLRIYRGSIAARKDDVGHTYTGITNHEFIAVRGGSVDEYAAGVKYGIEAGWFRIDESGTRVFVLAQEDSESLV